MVWSLDQEAAAAGRTVPAGSREPGVTRAIRKVPPTRGAADAPPGSPGRLDRWVHPAVRRAQQRTNARRRPRARGRARLLRGIDPYLLGASSSASSTLVITKIVAAPTVSLSRLRSTTVEPPSEVPMPPPNM